MKAHSLRKRAAASSSSDRIRSARGVACSSLPACFGPSFTMCFVVPRWCSLLFMSAALSAASCCFAMPVASAPRLRLLPILLR